MSAALPPVPSARLHWPAVKAAFEQLLEMPAPQRPAALARLGLDAASAAELRSLLAQHEAEEAAEASAAGGFLAHPPQLPLRAGAAIPPPDRSGQRLGPWELQQRLGSGGMADVWAARRADGAYAAQVAVKLLRPSAGQGQQVLARFALERRALARLEHPHIARLLDAGQAADGTPYFVMERVHGQPIDAACRGRPLEQRLALFLQLADAVAHAHRQLLVHRDLKPANVLVTAEGQVKLLDFGIAKALDPLEDAVPGEAPAPADPLQRVKQGTLQGARQDRKATDGASSAAGWRLQPGPADGLPAAGLTVAGERPLTPHYASPEQVRGDPVGTATDIHALGVLWFVMLTGRRPYAHGATGTGATMQAVLQDTPPAPSTVLDAADAQHAVLRRRLRGDGDRIVLKALAKDAAQRYATVEALAADLRAWQQGRPISARPASPAYLLRCFIGRHRLPVAASALALLLLLGTLVALVQQVQATDRALQTAERRFQQVRQVAQQLVFGVHDRIVNLAGALPAREALLADTLQMLDTLAQEVGGDARLAQELAATYHRVAALQGETFSPSLERLAAAEASLDKALALQPLYLDTPVAPAADALAAAVDMWLARSLLHARRGDLAGGQQALQQAQRLALRLQRQAGDSPATVSRLATLQGRLGLLLGGSLLQGQLGEVARAGEYLQHSVQGFETLVQQAPADPEWQHQLAWALGNRLAWALIDGQPALAAALGRRALALRESASAGRPDDAHLRHQVLIVRTQLGAALAWAGEHEEARALLDAVHAATAEQARRDTANRALQRDLAVLQVVRGRAAVLAGEPAQALRHLQAAWDSLPAGAALAGDFYLGRWRAEALLWRARARSAAQAAAALQDADQALAVLQATPEDPRNAARRWALALAHTERAAALRALRQLPAADAAAQSAQALWAGVVPGGLRAWAARAQGGDGG